MNIHLKTAVVRGGKKYGPGKVAVKDAATRAIARALGLTPLSELPQPIPPAEKPRAKTKAPAVVAEATAEATPEPKSDTKHD